MPEKKRRYTNSQAKAIKKYLKESVDDMRIRVPKGKKAYYMSIAKSTNESLNAFTIRALEYLIKAENLHPLDNNSDNS